MVVARPVQLKGTAHVAMVGDRQPRLAELLCLTGHGGYVGHTV